MAILELCGLKVLPLPDLDDSESLWISRGRCNHGSAVGWGAGFLPGPRTAEAGFSAVGRWLLGEDSEQWQPGGTSLPRKQHFDGFLSVALVVGTAEAGSG